MDKNIKLFGTTVLVRVEKRKSLGRLVLPEKMQKENMEMNNLVVHAIGPDVKNVKVGDICIMPMPSLHQSYPLQDKTPVFVVDESHIRGVES